MKKIVLASNNSGKLKELQPILVDYGYEVKAQAELGVDDADETGLTFVENAIIKARHACEKTGLPALADDSGLEVDALGGAPGIYSARYAGQNSSDEKNNRHLLAELHGFPTAERSARYQCVLVFMKHASDPTPVIAQGSWEGRILNAPQGQGGFGYDPLFWIPSHACSAAELDKLEKNTLSHRAQAITSLVKSLKQTITSKQTL